MAIGPQDQPKEIGPTLDTSKRDHDLVRTDAGWKGEELGALQSYRLSKGDCTALEVKMR